MTIDVFISYSSSNKAIADAICAGLEHEKIRCWIAPRDVLPGRNYGESIIQAIGECKVVVLVFSKDSNISQAVMREMERAMHHARPIIPFRLDDIPMSQGLEFYLASCHWLDAMNPPLEKHIAHLASAVKAMLGQPVDPGALPAQAVPRPARKSSNALLAGGVALAILAGIPALWWGWAKTQKGVPPDPPAGRNGDAAQEISCEVTLAAANEAVIRGNFRGEDPATVRYRSASEGDLLKIAPACPYLSAWEGTGTLRALRPVDGRYFPPCDVNLEIKLLNSGKHTVFFHRAVAEVKYSRSASRPLLVMDVSKPGRLRVTNVGAAVQDPVQVRLALAGPRDELDDARLPPPTTLPFPGGTAEIPLPGVDPSIEQTAYGELILGSRIRRFELAVGDRRKAAPSSSNAPPDAGHILAFRSPGEGYEIECPLSQYLQANEGDRIPLRLQAEESSVHRFRLRLEYDDGSGGPARVLRTRSIEAELFQPKQGP